MTYDNSNSGTINPNKDKAEPFHADGKGQGEITCEQCSHVNHVWIDMHNRTKKADGAPFKSLKFKPKKTAMQAMAKAEEPAPFDDDIPF